MAAETPAPRFTFPGLTGYVNRILRQLASCPAGAELEEIHRNVQSRSRRLEMSLERQKITAAQLLPPARALRGWLAFLAGERGVAAYVAAVGSGKAAIEAEMARQSRWKPPARLYLRPMNGMYKARQARDGFELSVPTAAVCFETADWEALARSMFKGDRHAKRMVLDRMQSETFQGLADELDALGGGAEESVGSHFDLGQVFDRINAAYFKGKMARPRLSWSRSATFRKFGHFDFIGDTVMLSRTLDAEDVPAFAVDFVMYHELLHKAHGLRWTVDSSRGYAHTAAFYRDEKRFPQHAEAEAALTRIARKRRLR